MDGVDAPVSRMINAMHCANKTIETKLSSQPREGEMFFLDVPTFDVYV